jgi:hypothetical protein
MPTMCTNGWENPNKLVVDERQFHFSFLASLSFSVCLSRVVVLLQIRVRVLVLW